jgi:hypothetical protein
MAAEAAGDAAKASEFYAMLLKSADPESGRSELDHVKSIVSPAQASAR